MSDPLEALAARATHDPFFLAALLVAFARSEGLDDAGLAAALGCPAADLALLRLCRAPREGPHEFWEDVTAIASHFGLGPERLAEAVKRGRVLTRLQAASPAGGLFLAAARDQEPEPPPKPPESP